MKMMRRSYLVLSLVVTMCFIIVSLQPAAVADEKDKRPPRAVEIYPEYPGLSLIHI